MFNHRNLTLVCLPLAWAGVASAQTLFIQPALQSGEYDVRQFDLLIGELPSDDCGCRIPFEVYLDVNGETVEVTEVVLLTVIDPEIATIDHSGPSPAVVFAEPGTVTLEACIGQVCIDVEVSLRPAPEPPSLMPRQGDIGEPVARQVLRTSVLHMLADLDARSIPVGALLDSLDDTIVADDRDAYRNIFGVSLRVTDADTGAIYIPSGPSAEWGLPFIRISRMDAIVLRPDVAEDFAADPIFPADGNPLKSEEIVLEELLHDVVSDNGLRKLFGKGEEGEDNEERVIGELITMVIPRVFTLMEGVQRPQWTRQTVQQIRNGINNLRLIIQRWRDDIGDEAIDAFLEAIGWEDADGNGLPDWLDQWLRDNGVNPDNLPDPEDFP
ncbi:MAG: hypothetical protein AAFX05_05375, partial [Planctomycetota bacterium]